MEKRFEVKWFLFETTRSEAVCRFMLTDRFLPILVPNQYIEMKSVNKLGIGKSHVYKLCVFFNFLHEKYHTEYDAATNKQVLDFIDYLIYGDSDNLTILHPQDSLCYSTLSEYVSSITDFYRWLDQTYGSEMTFYEGERKCRHQSYLYGHIYTYKYKNLINRMLPDVKCRREYVKWYTEEQKDCKHFVPEAEQLPYFKEQAITWAEKAEKFRTDSQMTVNYADIAVGFQRIIEKLEDGCYNGRKEKVANGFG